MRTRAIIATAAALILLAGCSKATNEDRTGVGNGSKPDSTSDTTHVDLYRNADGVPTVILFCVGQFRFASTAPGTVDGGTGSPPQLLRLPEQDSICGRKS